MKTKKAHDLSIGDVYCWNINSPIWKKVQKKPTMITIIEPLMIVQTDVGEDTIPYLRECYLKI